MFAAYSVFLAPDFREIGVVAYAPPPPHYHHHGESGSDHHPGAEYRSMCLNAKEHDRQWQNRFDIFLR